VSTGLKVDGLSVRYDSHEVLHGVGLQVAPGETVGLVGESGCGKTTLARAILGLVPASAGTVLFNGTELTGLRASQWRAHRRDLQVVFQNPLASLDPRMRIGESIAEPLRIFEPALEPTARAARVAAALERVGLEAQMAERYPHEFSGGQCQRVSIARATILKPKLLICDEPVSSLDVSVQGQIVNLLLDLQRDTGMSMLFISHNLAVVRQVSHRILVMYRGQIVESAEREALFGEPRHDYTRQLLAALPRGYFGLSLKP
jgi:ABC-type glutathione transport system ATPase component